MLSKKENDVREKLNVLEPFAPLELDLYKTARYKYMKVRFGRINVDYYKKLEKYLFGDLQAVFLEGTRNENYVYGCYFVANADMSKVDSAFNSLHFEKITIPAENSVMPEDKPIFTVRQASDRDGVNRTSFICVRLLPKCVRYRRTTISCDKPVANAAPQIPLWNTMTNR